MKTVLYSLVLLCFVTSGYSQSNGDGDYPRWQLSVPLGGTKLRRLPDGIDQLFSRSYQIVGNYNIRLGKKPFYISVGAGYEENNLVVDGLFMQNNNQYAFVPTDQRQNHIIMRSLHLPVMFKAVPFSRVSLGLGGYVNYLADAEHKYKIGSGKFSSDAPIQNKWNAGIKFEYDIVLGTRKSGKLVPVFGMGIQHQLSQYLSGARSFRPATGYVKLGIALW